MIVAQARDFARAAAEKAFPEAKVPEAALAAARARHAPGLKDTVPERPYHCILFGSEFSENSVKIQEI